MRNLKMKFKKKSKKKETNKNQPHLQNKKANKQLTRDFQKEKMFPFLPSDLEGRSDTATLPNHSAME